MRTTNTNYGGKIQGANNYVKQFNYGTNLKISEDLQLFASREETPTNNGVAVWNSSTERFETNRGVLIDPSGNMELLNGILIQRSRQPYPLSIYVSKSGNDVTGTGSESNPFLTIQRAINLSEEFLNVVDAVNFPNIYVNAGFYDETLTIKKNIRIYGVNEFTSNNLGNFAGFYATRIGSVNNFVNILSDMPSGSNHIIIFENLDFRCRISNVENGTPSNRILMVMNYSNINKPSDENPILNITGIGTGATQRSTLYISNVRSNGTCTSTTLPAYELFNTDLYIEESRWNGNASAVGMMRLTSTSTFINCEILQISVGSGITNLPTIVCNFTASSTVRFSNTILGMLYSAVKTIGANLITIPSGAPFGNTQNPTIIFDDCFMNIVNSTLLNYILQNNSGKNIRLQFHRVNNLSLASITGGIDYTNITVTETSTIITPVTNFLGSITMDETYLGTGLGSGSNFDISSNYQINITSNENIMIDPSNSMILNGKLHFNTNKININSDNCRISIGTETDQINQGVDSIAIGRLSAEENQNNEAISIGVGAGRFSQGFRTVALGYSAGYTNQGTHSIAIGTEAGKDNQGQNCIAIGSGSGKTNQHANSIILNATSNDLNSDGNSRCFVSPIRNDNSNLTMLQYNTITSEISFVNNTISPITTSGLNITGDSALLSGTASGDSGQYLSITINEIPYKIKLENH